MAYPHVKLENHVADVDECVASISFATSSNDATIETGLMPFGSSEVRFENWYTPQPPLARKQEAGLNYAVCDGFVFGSFVIHSQQSVEEATVSFYQSMFHALQACGDFYPLRIWHYLPILYSPTEPTPYQLFCRARSDVIGSLGASYCSATVIGTGSRQGVFYFLAVKQAGDCIENPRQTSAYHYPSQYANPAPLFNRAMLHKVDNCIRLYISGTASIVGHQSCHPGDVVAQLNEIADNIESVISTTTKIVSSFKDKSLDDLRHVKIYLKQTSDYDKIKPSLENRFSNLHEAQIFHGEICRPELLIEIEGMVEHLS